MTSLEDSQLDLFALHFDPTKNAANEFPLASTVGNPKTTLAGLPPFGGSLFRITLDVGFIGVGKPRNLPCFNLANAGFVGGDLMTGGCPSGATSDLSQNFAIVAPVTRDIIGRTRNKFVNSIGPSKDILGNDTPNGQYLSPVALSFPDELERSVQVSHPAFLFTGIPWNLDRRLGPLGCGKVTGDCDANANVRLDPWPWDGGVDPRSDPFNPPTLSVPASTANKIISYATGTPPQFLETNLLTLPTGPSTPIGVVPTTNVVPQSCTVK